MMGNDNIAAYQFMSQYKFLADNKGPYFGAGEDGHINQGFYQARVANPVVTWEKAKTLNLGLSTQFLNGNLVWILIGSIPTVMISFVTVTHPFLITQE